MLAFGVVDSCSAVLRNYSSSRRYRCLRLTSVKPSSHLAGSANISTRTDSMLAKSVLSSFSAEWQDLYRVSSMGTATSLSADVRLIAIDASIAHQITSGQVITDLSTSVKELVENSLDAGATNIGRHLAYSRSSFAHREESEVRFREHGVLSVEVIDNGSGIEEKDYANIGTDISEYRKGLRNRLKNCPLAPIALGSHTSKLASYEGLLEVSSFGFRGEALSSLCQLADLTMTTATAAGAPKGTILNFDKQGRLLSSSGKIARSVCISAPLLLGGLTIFLQRGTTVIVTNLFTTLPVRRKEFERNCKKQFGQAQTLLQAYALISVGTRLSFTNQQGYLCYVFPVSDLTDTCK